MLSTFDLLRKYDVPGPRYTSYPTVPAWNEFVTEDHYRDALSSVASDDKLSLYFHLPFCENLCHFCGCMQVITKDHSRSRPYVDTLLQELARVANHLKASKKLVSQIHFGGGTPNFIQPEEMSLIMEAIRHNFTILPDAEIAIEMHPRTSTKEFCVNLAKEGFNRISLGVQDFSSHVQKLINRHQTYEMTADMVEFLRALGFKNFNFDLVYGLPGQTHDGFLDTLQKTTALNPDRLAVYSYAHVPWVRPVQRSFADSDLPTPEQKLQLFESALSHFQNHHYHLIGMDHFAKETDELFEALQTKSIHRNFMGYSTRADAHQIGFGVSSISYVNGHYFQNQKKLKDYEDALAKNGLATFRGYLLNKDDHMKRDIITQLMCHREVDFNQIDAQYHVNSEQDLSEDFKHLQKFIEDDLITFDNNKLIVKPQGYIILRNIAMCFDSYLDNIKKNSTHPVFSRTV